MEKKKCEISVAKYCCDKYNEFICGDGLSVAKICDIMNCDKKYQKDNPFLSNLSKKGIYAFIDNKDKIVYIGQAGEGKTTTLKNRIMQEFTLYKKTEGGNNGGTFSKHLRDYRNVNITEFKPFYDYIDSWKIKVLHSNDFKVSTELLELFFIELLDPEFNQRGKKSNV